MCPPGLGDVCPSNFPVPLGFGRVNRSLWLEPGFLSQGGFMPFLFPVALGVCVWRGRGKTTQQHEGVPINASTPSALPGPFARASQCPRRPGITRAPSSSPGSGVPQLLSSSRERCNRLYCCSNTNIYAPFPAEACPHLTPWSSMMWNIGVRGKIPKQSWREATGTGEGRDHLGPGVQQSGYPTPSTQGHGTLGF